MKNEGFAFGSLLNFKKIMMKKLVSGGELWAPNIIKMPYKTDGFSMIYMFANV